MLRINFHDLQGIDLYFAVHPLIYTFVEAYHILYIKIIL